MNPPIFLLGAGFNCDAHVEAGPLFGSSIYIGNFPIEISYPTVSELWNICFPNEKRRDISIEHRLQEELDLENYVPIQNLCEHLLKCDYYLPNDRRDGLPTLYSQFFDNFPSSHFVTFNYDSLPECFLVRRKRWYPHDGYGFPIGVGYRISNLSSMNLILHLHGSLCVYESSFDWDQHDGTMWMKKRKSPLFRFDPGSIGSRFPMNSRAGQSLGDPISSQDIPHRIIAPVPSKAKVLKEEFIQKSYEKALDLISQSKRVITIGYAFNELDRASYDPILRQMCCTENISLIIIDPNAHEIVNRIKTEYSSLRITPIPYTLAQWASFEFPLE